MLPMPGKLCSADERFMRGLHHGLRRELPERKYLRTLYSDTNRHPHTEPHSDPRDTEPDAQSYRTDADPYEDGYQHPWSRRLLSMR